MITIITIFISTALYQCIAMYHHDQLPVQHDQIPPSPLPSGQEGKTTEDFQETDKGRQGWADHGDDFGKMIVIGLVSVDPLSVK